LKKEEHGFIHKHWLKIREAYIKWFKKEKQADQGNGRFNKKEEK
jgi:hypothetical protein